MKSLFALAFLCIPLYSFAAVGFAQESVWVSKTPVTVGEKVSVYAALTNGSTETLTGTAYFRDNGNRIGTLPVRLSPGEARIVSIDWSPKEGSHTLAVEFASTSVASAQGTETLSIEVTAPVPLVPKGLSLSGDTASAAAAAAFTDSSSLRAQLESLSPAVEHTLAPVITTLDSVRKSGSDMLTEQIGSAQSKINTAKVQKAALPASDSSDTASKGRWLLATELLYTLLMYIFVAVQTVLAKAGFFFPFVAILFFLILWKLYQRFRRPRY